MAYVYQNTRDRAKVGDKAPWSVGWYDSAGRKRSKKVGSKSLAEKFKRKKENELASGLVEIPRTKWADFRERFMDIIVATKSTATVRAYEAALDAFERIARPVYLDKIGTETIDRFRVQRSQERKRTTAKAGSKAAERVTPRVSPATVNMELRHLRGAMNKAYRWGLLPRTPVVEMLREPQRDPHYLDDADFAALYAACKAMQRPRAGNYAAADWWRALLTFAYLTGWRIGEILALRREDLDLEAGVATVDAENTKGRRTATVELHPVVVDHLRAIADFSPMVFAWPYHERLLWSEFTALKKAAGLKFPGAFHRLRFSFANQNVDRLAADVLQQLMRHQSPQTTRHYISQAARLKRAGVTEKLHVPECLRAAAT